VEVYRQHGIAARFGQVTVRLPRFGCAGCGITKAVVDWPPRLRSTPALDHLRASLSALMTYRAAAALLGQMFPVNAGGIPRRCAVIFFKVAEQLSMQATTKTPVNTKAIVVTLDSTFIRGCEDGERHRGVRIGDVETVIGSRQVFGAVAKTDTDLEALIRRSLDTVGRTRESVLTALTGSCPGVRRSRIDAGITGLPILDWFHLAMRLRHLTQIAGGLSSDNPERAVAKAVIVEEVDRLPWRLWNGKAKDAQIRRDRIHAVVHHFRFEQHAN
jgi:hypothetical protein